ncbi:extracellular solute-binding protein [Paenibacillus roseipurpureus]|uniref:Extracellular solute-binding protein n=1 Tax=Paenibacillus roseopurpureus TaxID=2918901 RepID=A0AA96LPB6_9BACL|nr:extracellular solute-binding protein [Paenibacillus sp. MBLB1832]WNR45752.1 extracellular solute-binding protein [Paenibacillus sp. MBLB1832]
MRNWSTKFLTGSITIALAATVAGCGSSNQSGTGASASPQATKAASKEPIAIKILTTTYAEAPPTDVEAIKKLNEKFNVKLSFEYAPVNGYQEKLNALLASNDLPDVTLVWDLNGVQSYANAAKQGAFWELTPYIKNYSNLAKYDTAIYKGLLFEGKTYGIPRVRPLDGHRSLVIRQDWLDKLGLKVPQNMDELWKVMDAFTNNDPDGNGKKDTYAVGATGEGGFANSYTIMFGTSDKWTLDGKGGIIPSFLTPQFRQGIEYWSKAFKAGFLPQDLPILKSSQGKDQMVQGKAGIAFGNVNDSFGYNQIIQKTDPKAKFVSYELPAAPDGKRYYDKASGSFGQMVINKKSVNEEKLKKILEIYDYTATKEGYFLTAYGIQDVDYKTTSLPFLVTQTEEGKKKYTSNSSQWLSGIFNKYSRGESSGMTDEEIKHNYQVIDAIAPNSYPDPSAGLVSPTGLEKGADWTKKLQDGVMNVVIGKSNMDDFDKLVKSFKDDSAYQKYIAEMNAGYKANQK